MTAIEMQRPIVQRHSKKEMAGYVIILILAIIIGSLALEYRHERQQDAAAKEAITALANVFNPSW